MKKYLLLLASILVFSHNANAGNVIPTFNLSGTWQPSTGGTSNIFQENTEVTIISTNAGFHHYFVGRYYAPNKIKGVVHRINKNTGCATEMLGTITPTDANNLSVSGLALDSSCDLVKGNTYSDSSFKIQ